MDAATNWTWAELDPEAARDPAERAAAEQAALEDAIREAYQRGVKDGLVQGATQAENRLRTAHQALDRLIGAFGESGDAWRESMSDSMAAIAVGIARQILDRELSVAPDTVEELIAAGLDRFPADHAIRIRVSHEDYAALKASGAAEEMTKNRWAQWSCDDALGRGSFLIEGPENIIDGRIDHALENIYRKLSGG